ncbi:MAG: DoxX family membrane protein [Blastocatellia bacterium]|nr:DoxX family membrane protein [Blastocatellia bacterium]
MHYDHLIKNLPALFCALFVAILFLQSGLDKVFDWKGNIEWLTGHFSKTFLAPFTKIMVAKITVLELLTGLAATAGIVYFFVAGSTIIIFYAAALAALTITGLFFGQRVAKDYAGAAVLVPYFLLTIVLMFLTMPSAIGGK